MLKLEMFSMIVYSKVAGKSVPPKLSEVYMWWKWSDFFFLYRITIKFNINNSVDADGPPEAEEYDQGQGEIPNVRAVFRSVSTGRASGLKCL